MNHVEINHQPDFPVNKKILSLLEIHGSKQDFNCQWLNFKHNSG